MIDDKIKKERPISGLSKDIRRPRLDISTMASQRHKEKEEECFKETETKKGQRNLASFLN